MIQAILNEAIAWSRTMRENFQVCLLAALYVGFFLAMLHVSHDAHDSDQIGFVEQVLTGVGGCLFGFLKGRESVSIRTGDPPTTMTVGPNGSDLKTPPPEEAK